MRKKSEKTGGIIDGGADSRIPAGRLRRLFRRGRRCRCGAQVNETDTAGAAAETPADSAKLLRRQGQRPVLILWQREDPYLLAAAESQCVRKFYEFRRYGAGKAWQEQTGVTIQFQHPAAGQKRSSLI